MRRSQWIVAGIILSVAQTIQAASDAPPYADGINRIDSIPNELRGRAVALDELLYELQGMAGHGTFKVWRKDRLFEDDRYLIRQYLNNFRTDNYLTALIDTGSGQLNWLNGVFYRGEPLSTVPSMSADTAVDRVRDYLKTGKPRRITVSGQAFDVGLPGIRWEGEPRVDLEYVEGVLWWRVGLEVETPLAESGTVATKWIGPGENETDLIWFDWYRVSPEGKVTPYHVVEIMP